jgi:hypothetical protein
MVLQGRALYRGTHAMPEVFMQATRNTLFGLVVMVAIAALACQPTDGLLEDGARSGHALIAVPASPTLLPPPTTP